MGFAGVVALLGAAFAAVVGAGVAAGVQAAPAQREIIYRHSVVVRVTHWINVLCLALLLMSGLKIFNYHPALYWGNYGYKGMPSFISKWVFQGNTSPLCLEKYLTEVARTPFEVVVIKNDRHNYFLSCKKWAENLEAKRDEVIARWGKHLYRRFVLYLWSAANSFETGTLSAHHMILQLPAPGSAPRAAMESWT
jgi:hypothetical protein